MATAPFNSRWWSVQLPDGWQAIEHEECVTISATHSPSALQISAARKDAGLITDEDLRQFAVERLGEEMPLTTVNLTFFTGLYAEYLDNHNFWREWWLRAGVLMIYGTYNTDEKLKETERVLVDTIVKTLKPTEIKDDKS